MKKISSFLVIAMIVSLIDVSPSYASTVDTTKEYSYSFGTQLSNEYGIAVYNSMVDNLIQKDGEFAGLVSSYDLSNNIVMRFQDLTTVVRADNREQAEQLIDDWFESEKAVLKTEAYAAVDAFVKDYPQVYWLSGSKLRFSMSTYTYQDIDGVTIEGSITLRINPSMYFNEAQDYLNDVNSGIIDAQNAIISQYNITGETTQTDILKAIHDYIAKKVTYNNDAAASDGVGYEYAHTILPVFTDNSSWNNSVVCEGYAKAFKILADRFGIETVIMVGSSINTRGEFENHMWNAAKIEGKWYGVDVTWDDQPNKLYDTYFLAGNNTIGLTKKTFSRDHIAESTFSESDYSSEFVIPVIADKGLFDKQEETTDSQQNDIQDITKPNQTTSVNEVTTTSGKNENNKSNVKEERLRVSVRYSKDYVYIGKAIKAKVVVVVNGKTLVAGKDYEVKYSNNIKIGKAKGVVTFKGNYSKVSAYTISYNITKIKLNTLKCSNLKFKKAKNGKYVLKSITYKVNGKKVKAGKDISVKYKWFKNKLKITVKGKGVYTGSKTINIKI
ncbi:MAG: hypothetical protein IKN54_08750, partial [Lachnospiraceae bacterium]|nr:hypothetical protein [Lachnospiraceae bacterium]